MFSGMSISSSLTKVLSGPSALVHHSVCKFPYSMFYPWLSCADHRPPRQAVISNNTIHPQAVCLLGENFLPEELLLVRSHPLRASQSFEFLSH